MDVHARLAAPGTAAVAFPFVAVRTARIPVPGLGVLGLDPATAIALPAVTIPVAVGTASFSIPVPNSASLVGDVWFLQAVQREAAVRQGFSNVLAAGVER